MEEKRCMQCMNPIGEGVFCPHCGFDNRSQNAPHQLPMGTMLRGQYLVGKVLGQGGFGITYMGWDTVLQTPVAIKEYYPNGFVNRNCQYSLLVTLTEAGGNVVDHNRQRFLREAQSLAKLAGMPEVVRVLNFFPENGTAYIVMEYVQGQTMKAYVSQYGQLSADWVMKILYPMMLAMQKLHDAGIIHRDISPDNIMVLPDGRVKILDFGAVRDYSLSVTHNTQAILKPGFAPPEQYQQSGNIGPWTDVYAFCATLYYCMTGQLAPDAPKRMMENIHPQWDRIPGLTPYQIDTLTRGMALRIPDRIQSMEQLAYLLFTNPQEEHRRKQQEQERLLREREQQRNAQLELEKAQRKALEEANRIAREQARIKAEEAARKKAQQGGKRKLEDFEKRSLYTIGLVVAVMALVLIFGRQDTPRATPKTTTAAAQATAAATQPATESQYTAGLQNLGNYGFDLLQEGDKRHYRGQGLNVWISSDGLIEATVDGLTLRDSYQVNDPSETTMVHQYNWSLSLITPEGAVRLTTNWAVEVGKPVKTVTLDDMEDGLWLRDEKAFAEGKLSHSLVDVPVEMDWDAESMSWSVRLPESLKGKFDSNKISAFQVTVYETGAGQIIKRNYGEVKEPWDNDSVYSIQDEAKNIEAHSADTAAFQADYNCTATYTDEGMLIVGPGLQILVENNRDMTVDIFGLNIADDYTINYPGSMQYFVEAGWEMRLMGSGETVELSTRVTHDEPGSEKVITAQNMDHYISAQYKDMDYPEAVDYIDNMTCERNHLHWEASIPTESQFSYNEGLKIPFRFRDFDRIVVDITDETRNIHIVRSYTIQK